MKLTKEEIIEFRDRIFAAEEHYCLEEIAAELMERYGLHHAAKQAREGRSFDRLADEGSLISRTLHALLLCCEAQYIFRGGYGDTFSN